MKIGILSDSHDQMTQLEKAVERFHREDVAWVLHAGDFVSPIAATPLGALRVPFLGVFGNCDGDRLYLTERFRDIGDLHAGPHEFEIEGTRIVLMHEPSTIDALAASRYFDLVIYGHTHRIDVRVDKALVVNPGECCGLLSGRATVAVVDTEAMTATLLDL